MWTEDGGKVTCFSLMFALVITLMATSRFVCLSNPAYTLLKAPLEGHSTKKRENLAGETGFHKEIDKWKRERVLY